MQDCHCVELLYAPATGHSALFNNIFKLLVLHFYTIACIFMMSQLFWLANSDNLFVPSESI